MAGVSGGRGVLWAWLLLLVAIPSMSIWGRPLLGAWRSLMSIEWLALMMFLVTLAAVVAGVFWVRRNGGGYRTGLLLSAWVIPLFLLLPLTLPVVEERLHFLLFGGLGFFSMLLFPPLVAVAVAVLGSGLDELLQWKLPDRVGDWRDVGFNVAAALGGVVTAWLGQRR